MILKDNPNLIFKRPTRWQLLWLRLIPRKKILVEDRQWKFYAKKMFSNYYILTNIFPK